MTLPHNQLLKNENLRLQQRLRSIERCFESVSRIVLNEKLRYAEELDQQPKAIVLTENEMNLLMDIVGRSNHRSFSFFESYWDLVGEHKSEEDFLRNYDLSIDNFKDFCVMFDLPYKKEEIFGEN